MHLPALRPRPRERIQVGRKISRLERDVIGSRRERDALLKLRDSRDVDLGALRRQVDSLASQDEFIESRLREFVREFETRLEGLV